MDIDNFEWWYSEGEAPDEEWDEPALRCGSGKLCKTAYCIFNIF